MTEPFTFRSPGGPAFVPWDGGKHDLIKMMWGGDYVWQAETDCTMAGWVRRRPQKESAIPEAGREANSGSTDEKRYTGDN